MRPQDLLLLEHEELKKKVDSLFTDLIKKKDDDVLQVLFNNPSELFVKQLLPEELDNFPRQTVSNANRFLFSALSNSDFFNWLNKEQDKIIADLKAKKEIRPDYTEILQDFAKALVDYGDKELIFSSYNAAFSPTTTQRVNPSSSVAVLVGVAAVILAVVVAIPIVFLGIVNNPLGEPIIPKGISPQELRALSEQIIARANELKKQGKLMDPNYDFS